MPVLNFAFTPWRLLNVVFSSICAVGAVCMFSCYESPRYHLRMGDEKKALVVLRAIFAINTGKRAEDYGVSYIVF